MNDALQNIKTIAKRELSGYFASPVAYVFIVIFLLLCGFFTFMAGGFFERDQASLVAFFMFRIVRHLSRRAPRLEDCTSISADCHTGATESGG